MTDPETGAALRRLYAICPARHGLMLYNPMDAYVGRSLELYGEFSEGEAELFGQMLRPGQVVVEAGSNVGAHTLFLAEAVGPSGAVFAFEPQRLVFQMLCANLALNDLINVRACQAAVGSAPGFITVPLLDPSRPQNVGGLGLGNWSEGEKVPVMTIDSLELARCDLLKADVEGMEAEVLAGAAETIRRHQPVLYVENDRKDKSEALIRLIFELGYRAWWHLPPMFNPANFRAHRENVFGSVVSVNLLCVPQKRPANIALREVTSPTDTWRP
jgi:FkbM family methyltransferase